MKNCFLTLNISSCPVSGDLILVSLKSPLRPSGVRDSTVTLEICKKLENKMHTFFSMYYASAYWKV